TFALGSFTLLGAAAILRFVHPPETPTSSIPSSEPSPTPANYSLLPALGWIFITGAGVAWGSNFLIQTMRKVMQALIGSANLDWVMFVIAIALALAALPAGAIATKLGNGRAMLWGIGVTMGLMLLIALIPNWFVVLIAVVAIVAAFSLIVNGAVPYALSLMPPQRVGLGTGMYFGGYSVAAGLFGMVSTQLRQMTSITAAVFGAIAFLVAGLCIAVSTSKSAATT
ncbi:MAG: MFS transporter, partial [Cyanobacteriota bacterium]